jgi:hypothetical protein
VFHASSKEHVIRWMNDWDAELNRERAARVTGYRGGESGYRTIEENDKTGRRDLREMLFT